MTDIPINLAVEDALSEAVLQEILKQSQQCFAVGCCYRKGGNVYLKKILPGLNNAAKGMPHFVLTDLDQADCPLAIISEWLTQPKHPNLLFRVAVRESGLSLSQIPRCVRHCRPRSVKIEPEAPTLGRIQPVSSLPFKGKAPQDSTSYLSSR